MKFNPILEKLTYKIELPQDVNDKISLQNDRALVRMKHSKTIADVIYQIDLVEGATYDVFNSSLYVTVSGENGTVQFNDIDDVFIAVEQVIEDYIVDPNA